MYYNRVEDRQPLERSNTMAQTKKQFIVDERGHKQSIVLPLKDYQELLEDLEDLATIAERKGDPAEPLDIVRQRHQGKSPQEGDPPFSGRGHGGCAPEKS